MTAEPVAALRPPLDQRTRRPATGRSSVILASTRTAAPAAGAASRGVRSSSRGCCRATVTLKFWVAPAASVTGAQASAISDELVGSSTTALGSAGAVGAKYGSMRA